ncbi:MAG: hypothetical protein GY722_22020 [bacterium]|nr:hypothetical protein [bacterium]
MTGNAIHHDLVGVLSWYLSDASVEATLKTVLEKRGLSEVELTQEDLPDIVADSMVGLRAFCSPDVLPRLMLQLVDLCDDECGLPRGSSAEGLCAT